MFKIYTLGLMLAIGCVNWSYVKPEDYDGVDPGDNAGVPVPDFTDLEIPSYPVVPPTPTPAYSKLKSRTGKG